jgi:Uri superfamily endonuclease
MNSIPNAPGVYILVLYLSQTTAITFNRKSSRHLFPPGWYVYVGSARGPGGLSRRVARHQRRNADGKRMHWNVDYFREHATLCEVWYCETESSEAEHQWACVVRDLTSATVPVLKFGANDCTAGCPSHFFHLADRPSTVEFRSKLESRTLSTKVFVEFFEEPPESTQAASELQSEYLIGRRFLESRRREIEESDLAPSQWLCLAKHQPARKLAELLAKLLKLPFPEFKHAIEFATAVETLIENCGVGVVPVLFDSQLPQSRKAIMQLSRTCDVRQRHRVQGIISGRFRSIGPQPDDVVFDTVAFGEVPSRLGRAWGSLEQLAMKLQPDASVDLVREAQQLCKLCRLSVDHLEQCLNAVGGSTPAIPPELSKESIVATLKAKNVTGKIIGKARLALRLTVKNLWDFEEMVRRGLLPTTAERQIVETQIQRIRSIAMRVEQIRVEANTPRDGKEVTHGEAA